MGSLAEVRKKMVVFGLGGESKKVFSDLNHTFYGRTFVAWADSIIFYRSQDCR